ncbi:hypothetical protein [Brachybacterium kimchii]|uniref:Phage portal protein n=1 Tax=Brachybacterium kimchii TaxID=2942909 RepID=A0ABY4NBA2_9MICO|nr:hypothetical protein [Brachybacterium kimchii]UQN30665.1 hypothetical protein M4486_05010 [Brachybacterium kimchii]
MESVDDLDLLEHMADELGRAQSDLRRWRDYFEGKPPLPDVDDPAQRENYERLLRISRINLTETTTLALADRTQLLSFRTALDSDAEGDAKADQLMTASGFHAIKRDLMEFVYSYGRGLTLVERASAEGAAPRCTLESPEQTTAYTSPGAPLDVQGALKVYRDPLAREDVLVLFRPGYNLVARRPYKGRGAGFTLPGQGKKWRLRLDQWEFDAEVEATGLDEVPVTPWSNRRGLPEVEGHIETVDRINHRLMQQMVIIALQAFRQRALEGAPLKDPQTGKPIDYDEIFSSDPGSMWVLPPGVKLWESGQADLSPVLKSVQDDIQYFALETRTPMYMFTPDAANGSAEGASLQREGIVFKAEDRIDRLASPAVRTMSQLFRLSGDAERADIGSLEAVWAPPERESAQARAEAAARAKEAGVPWRDRMAMFIKASPREIGRMETNRAADALLEGDAQ